MLALVNSEGYKTKDGWPSDEIVLCAEGNNVQHWRQAAISSMESSSMHPTTSPDDDDDWSSIKDPNERRRVQNRLAQRKFRDKLRQQKEELERNETNKRLAASAYTAPEPEDVDVGDETGLPWGSMSLRHIVSTGRSKEQSSRETSIYAAASRAGGSSRLGLHLLDQYARGSPAWTAWRPRLPDGMDDGRLPAVLVPEG